MNVARDMRPSGALTMTVTRAQKAPLSWRIRNAMRWTWWKGTIGTMLARMLSWLTGMVTITTALSIRVRRADGTWIDYGVVSRQVVTDAGVAFIVDDMDNSTTDITTLNYHGFGTGTTAEAANQTALVTESTTALNPDSTRPTGTKTQPAANQLQSVGTATFDASAAITEHGIFSQAATGGGTMLDRSVFSAINVASGDSIQATYVLTFSSGG